MLVVKKHQLNEKPRVLFSLSPEQKQLIARIFVQGEPIAKEKKAGILALLSQIRNLEGWLSCDCSTHDTPLFTVKRIHQNGTLFLSRINTRGMHSPGCIFARGLPVLEKRSGPVAAYWKDRVFHLHGRNNDIVLPDEKSQETSSTGAGTIFPRLGRILYTFLERAGLNVISDPIDNINRQYWRLQEAADDFFLEPGIKVSKYFWTHPGQVGYAGFSLKASKAPWPRNSRRYGILVTAADKILEKEKSILCKIKEQTHKISFAGVMKKQSGRTVEASAPYLVISTVTDAVRDGYYEPVNSFIVPIYSRALLVPIDSSYERKVLEGIIKALLLWKKQGIEVKIKKPLFDTPVYTKEGMKYIRPDFLISGNGKHVILEVGGSHEPEYLERKKRTHELMRGIGELFNFDAYEADKRSTWQVELNKMIVNLSCTLMGG